MSMHVYACSKCGHAIHKDGTPNPNGCSEATYHDWKNLGEVGDTNYSCKKCGSMVQTKSTPAPYGCTSSNYHDWKKQ